MKTYIVYLDGVERGKVQAGSHNAAEKKAQDKYAGKTATPEERRRVSVAYTEV